MIKVTVYLTNDHNSKYENVEITKEEILQFACNKVKGSYEKGCWNKISTEDEIEINLKQ